MHEISRRNILTATALGMALCTAGIARTRRPNFQLESDKENMRAFENYHRGLGSIGMRIFDFGGAAAPANFLIYDIPPGASEGVHVHNLTDPELGAFDEYYYIIEGRARMMIGGEPIMVRAGDHIHTPLDVPHGIENIDADRRLKVFLTYIDRSPKSAGSGESMPK